jgi:hypothetical protein
VLEAVPRVVGGLLYDLRITVGEGVPGYGFSD